MLQIISGVKRNDGIIVVFEDADILKSVFFAYSGLVDRKINALDLIDHPSLNLIDPEKNMIAMKCGMDSDVTAKCRAIFRKVCSNGQVSVCRVFILSAYVRGSIHHGYDEEGIGYNTDLSFASMTEKLRTVFFRIPFSCRSVFYPPWLFDERG